MASGDAGPPGFGATGFDLQVVASAPFHNENDVPFAESFLVLRTNRPVANAEHNVSLVARYTRVQISVEALTDHVPFIVRVTPEAGLVPDVSYELRVHGGPDGLMSLDGAVLMNDVVIRFRTRSE